jgi:glycosyltransferase involved in cell wall biosynthesis
MGGPFRFLKRLIFGSKVPNKFLTPDGAPKVEAAKPTAPPPPPPRQPKPHNPNRVCLLITKSNFGGAQRYVYDLAVNMPEGYETTVMCGSTGTDSEQMLLVNKLALKGIPTTIVPELTRDISPADVRALWKLYQEITLENPAVLHLNSSKAGVLGALAGRLAGVPRIIYTSHGWAFSEKRNIFSKSLIWLASIATILLSHVVICVSAHDKNKFAGWFFQKKLVVVRNAIAEIDYTPRDKARTYLVPHYDLYTKDIWIGTIAELTKNKNISLGLKAVAKVREKGVRLFYCIVGDGEERFDLQDEARELGIDDSVKFLGFLADAPRHMQAFDIFLLPSRKEGLPYVLLEAQSAQVPIIASNVGGVSEIVRDGENGILCPSGDLESFSRAIEALATDPLIRTQFSRAESPSDFATMLRETFALYLPR